MTDRVEGESPHDAVIELFESAEDNRTTAALVKLARKDIVDVYWDDDDEAFRWRLTELGVHLCESGELEDYIAAAERPGLGEPESLKRSIHDE